MTGTARDLTCLHRGQTYPWDFGGMVSEIRYGNK